MPRYCKVKNRKRKLKLFYSELEQRPLNVDTPRFLTFQLTKQRWVRYESYILEHLLINKPVSDCGDAQIFIHYLNS